MRSFLSHETAPITAQCDACAKCKLEFHDIKRDFDPFAHHHETEYVNIAESP